jgi:hypothetical protein
VPAEALIAMTGTADGSAPSQPFSVLCAQRAHGQAAGGWSVARNGMVIEQSQILTTHNMAPLVVGLGLEGELAAQAGELARRAFDWAVATEGRSDGAWHHRLRRVKNAAYAWRQMVFFLAWMAPEAQAAFCAWAEERVGEAQGLQERFAPALRGLRLAIQGETTALAPDGRLDADVCFLGWTTGRHWLRGQAATPHEG